MTATALEPSSPPTAAKHLAGALLVAPRTSRPGWVVEVSSFPARSLFELPLPFALELSLPDDGIHVRIGPAITSETPALVLDSEEWRALVTATEADRVWPEDLRAVLRRKALEPGSRVRLEDALAGGQPDPAERWSVSRVLARWGAELRSVTPISDAIIRDAPTYQP